MQARRAIGSRVRRRSAILPAMDLDAALLDELRRAHGAHTVILYGSRARGEIGRAHV